MPTPVHFFKRSDDGTYLDADGPVYGSQREQVYLGTITLAELNAGKTLIPGILGKTITPTYFRLKIVGTAGGSGNFILQDTNGTPVVITTITQGALATAANSFITSETVTLTGKTDGAGLMGALTAGKGIAVPAAASITGLTSIAVVIKYLTS